MFSVLDEVSSVLEELSLLEEEGLFSVLDDVSSILEELPLLEEDDLIFVLDEVSSVLEELPLLEEDDLIFVLDEVSSALEKILLSELENFINSFSNEDEYVGIIGLPSDDSESLHAQNKLVIKQINNKVRILPTLSCRISKIYNDIVYRIFFRF